MPGMVPAPKAAPATKKPATTGASPAAGQGAGRGAAQAPAAGPQGLAAARGGAASSPKDLKYPPLGPIQSPKVESVTLPNGMKLYLLEDHELPLVNGSVWIRTGNLFDPPDKAGLAAITGMLLRMGGARAKTGEQLDEQLENIGAVVESSIGRTAGTVTFSALKESAGEALGVVKDVLAAPEFRQDKIDLARAQLRGSIARRNDDARVIAQREFEDILYGRDTPYGRLMQYATVARITRGDIQGFYKRYFFPKNVMLGVWGDFDAAQMKTRIEKLFSDWNVEQPPAPEFPAVRGTPAPGAYLAEKTDVQEAFFAAGQLGGEIREKDYPALEIMADILGGGSHSRLVERVRVKMGYANDIGAKWRADYTHPGIFSIAGSAKPFSTVDVIKAIQQEVDRIRTSEVTEEELQIAKDVALNRLVFAPDTRADTLQGMLAYEYYGYPKDFIQQHQKGLAAVTRADVLRVAKEHLNPGDFAIVAAGNPQSFAQPLEALGGPVNALDLTIPEPKQETAQADEASLAQGKQLLSRAQQAAGGVDKLAAVKDYTEVSDFQLDPAAGGYRVKQTDRWIAPSYFRQDIEVPTGKISAYSDGKIGWIATPQGSGPLAGTQLKQLRGDLFRLYFRLLLSDRIEGRAVNAVEDNMVEIVDATGEIARVVFDAATGLPQRVQYELTQAKGAPVSVEDLYEDFRDVGGVKVPHRITINRGGKKFADMTVADYQVNSGLKLPELEKRP
jgi:predicted Zn-dependent peptidase